MNDNKVSDGHVRGEESSELFKSSGMTPHKVDAFSNSAVSGHAVDHLDAEPVENKVFVGFEPHALKDDLHVGSAPQGSDQVHVGNSPEAVAPDTYSAMDELDASVRKAEQMMQAVEAQRAEVESKLQEAQLMLQQVEQIKAFISVDDSLRNRINATVARTASLRSAVSADESGNGRKK